MKIEVKDKNGKVLSNGDYVLEALGFEELYKKLDDINGWPDEVLVNALALLAKERPHQIDDKTWRVYLADNIVLYLKKSDDGHWFAEFVLPFEYKDDLVFFLRRMEKLLQRVKGIEQTIERLKGDIDALEDALNNLIEEREDKKKRAELERFADALERLVACLEEREE
ncbi:hypothetical protein [Thermofilum sp.]|uniref:hypothetical protein n=1 Tax=Thermofilum sp. TaxID=1961369 RepID=UPI0025886C9B|nr:hypothetical protein [Thermofilum sp.]